MGTLSNYALAESYNMDLGCEVQEVKAVLE